MTAARDPRDIITPDAFTVAPELLGLPLARPARRAAAILIDLALVSLMIKAISFTVFVLAAALLLLRVARPSPKGGRLRRSVAWAVRVGAIVLLAVFGVIVYGKIRNLIREPRITIGGEAQPDSITFGLADLRALGYLSNIENSQDEAAARASARQIASWVEQRSADPAQRATVARWLLAEFDEIQYAHVLEQELAPVLGERPPEQPQQDVAAVRTYLDALDRGDSAEASRVLRDAQIALAGDRISRLEREQRELSTVVDTLTEALEEQRAGGGVRRFLAGLADDFGVGFGWMAVYFTAFVVLWNGQTPGKRLLGIRIIRLDAKPLSWWLAFERFGGYAASFSTGLLGFAQILWDRNRQGMHDKFIETVVIREAGARATASPLRARSAPPPPRSAPPGSRPQV